MFEPLPDDAAAVVGTKRHVKQQSTDAAYRGVKAKADNLVAIATRIRMIDMFNLTTMGLFVVVTSCPSSHFDM